MGEETMTYEEFKALSFDERRSYIADCRKRGFSDRQTALRLGLTPEQVGAFYHITERLGVQSSKNPDFKRSDTLCWECKKACGYCSWSQEFVPVPGWEAVIETPKGTQFTEKFKKIPDYKVLACPEFSRGRRMGE